MDYHQISITKMNHTCSIVPESLFDTIKHANVMLKYAFTCIKDKIEGLVTYFKDYSGLIEDCHKISNLPPFSCTITLTFLQ